jgi:phage terminase large subunit
VIAERDIPIPTWVGSVTTEWLTVPNTRPILIHEGGTRSSKTYNIAIAWIAYLSTVPEWLSIVRATGPALKATVERDVIEILRRFGLYSEARHNKSDGVFTMPHGGGTIEFFATDQDQKVHGRKRDHLWLNEANEIPESLYDQLAFRTRARTVLDFNPSMREDHWIWRRFDGNSRVRRYRSTYLDNPFLSAEQVATIEAMKEQDEWTWKVYGLGVRGVPPGAIFQDVRREDFPDVQDYVYGLDFGYNDPMCLVQVARRDAQPKARVYVKALVHESYITTADLIGRMRAMGVRVDRPIYCDSAEPDRIEELRRAGFYALPADKGPGSVRHGIDYLQRHSIAVSGPAVDPVFNAFRAYAWKNIRGVVQDEPAHAHSHAPDATRYAVGHYSGGSRPALY